MKTKQIILICEECCRRLRETYQFLIMCDKNSAVLQGYMAQINTTAISNSDNDAELRVDLNNKQDDIIKIKCEIKSEDEEIYTFVRESIIEESEVDFMNVDDDFVKEEDSWKMEGVDDREEPAMDNNSTESSDKETDTEIAVNSNTHDTDTDSDGSESTSTNTKKERSRVHGTVGKQYICAVCKKCLSRKSNLVGHMRTHTGEKPYECSRCTKCFSDQSHLVCHMRTQTGEKPYKCSICEKGFTKNSDLVRHTRTHTGEKPYKCSKYEKGFNDRSNFVRHMRSHTGVVIIN